MKKILIIVVMIVIVIVYLVPLFVNYNSYYRAFQKEVPKDVDDFAINAINLVKERNFTEVIKYAAPGVISPTTMQSQLNPMADTLNKGKLEKTEIVYYNVVILTGTAQVSYQLSYQYLYNNQAARVDIQIDDTGEKKIIPAFRVNTLPKSLEELNAFTFKGKTNGYYIFFIITLLLFLANLYVLYLLLRTNIELKWLWVLFIYLGLGTLNLNWTTGDVHSGLGIAWPFIRYFSDGVFSPWIITLSLPIGSLIFIFRKRLFHLKESESKPEVPDEKQN